MPLIFFLTQTVSPIAILFNLILHVDLNKISKPIDFCQYMPYIMVVRATDFGLADQQSNLERKTTLMCRKNAKNNDSDPRIRQDFRVSECQYFSFFLRLAEVRSAKFNFRSTGGQFRPSDSGRVRAPASAIVCDLSS